MFGIGMPEMLLILAVALIVLGPKKLPDIARSMGRAVAEFRKATRDLKETLEIDPDLREVKKAFDDVKTDVRSTVDTAPAAVTPPAPAASRDPEASMETAAETPTAKPAPEKEGADHDPRG